jgi:hypothetical protein
MTMFQRLFGSAALILLTVTFTAPARAGHDPAGTLQGVLDELDVMEALLAGKVNDAARRELLRKVQSMRTDVRDVQQTLLRAHGSTNVSVSTDQGPLVSITMVEVDDSTARPIEEAIVPLEPLAMASGPFLQLEAAIENEAFDDGKLAVLQTAARGNHFTVSQASTLVSLLTFSDGKVDAAATLYPLVVDPENWYQIYGVFDFDSDKEALRSRLGL